MERRKVVRQDRKAKSWHIQCVIHMFLFNDSSPKPFPPFILPFCLQNNVRSISVSPDGQWVASGSGDHVVRIWDLRNAALQCTLKRHKDRVWSVDFCPTGNYLVSGGGDGQVVLWRYEAA